MTPMRIIICHNIWQLALCDDLDALTNLSTKEINKLTRNFATPKTDNKVAEAQKTGVLLKT